ncbi:universal stress protein [Streptomyces sp. WAC00263]|uniref:universal stress protein n=1 Tax=Streptomyces sp. WAC00263 TaxID=1917422 RepID=UPI00321F9B06
MTTRHVTVGVDGTLIAVRALDRAAEEAVLRGALLDIVYAVPDLDEAGPVLASAAARVRERHPGLSVTASAFEGGPVQALAEHGRDAELTVVGTRGLGGIAGLLFGSVSLRLVARTAARREREPPIRWARRGVARPGKRCRRGCLGVRLRGGGAPRGPAACAALCESSEPDARTTGSPPCGSGAGRCCRARTDRTGHTAPRGCRAAAALSPGRGGGPARSTPAGCTRCWRRPAKPPSWSSVPTATPTASARNRARSPPPCCTTPLPGRDRVKRPPRENGTPAGWAGSAPRRDLRPS